MCLDIIYRCPLCKTPSGNRDHHECENGEEDCPGVVKVYRWNQPKHFFNWFCSDDTCDYSRVTQAVAALEIEDIMKAQEMGYARPPKSRIATTTTVNSEDHLDKPTVPQLGDMAHNPEITANTEKPDKNPSTGPARHTSPKAWVDLTTLEAKVQKEIQQLRVKINRLGTTRKVLSWWSNDETQLLGLCTSLKLPMKQTASYLPRHDLSGCRSRLSVLREKGQALMIKPPRAVTQAVKKSVAPSA